MIDGYLQEVQQIVPADFEAYQEIPTRRACERVLQVAIEAMIDTCTLLVSGLRLGAPGDEEDMITRLEASNVITPDTADKLRGMKGFRNILVDQYDKVDDQLVYEHAQSGIEDFEQFKQEVMKHLAPGE